MTKLLSDPRVVNYILMILFLVNAGRWALERRYWDAGYWLSTFLITLTVTFGR